MRTKLTACVIAAICTLASSTAFADLTDVINVPMAEVLERGQFRFGVQQDLDYIDSDQARRTTLLSTYGVTDKFEVGLDWYQIGGDDDVKADAKLQIRDPKTEPLGLAIGVYNVGPDTKTFYFAVATKRYGDSDIHLGFGGDGHYRGLIAGRYALMGRSLRAFAEWITGPGRTGEVSAGLQAQPNDRWEFDLYWQGFNSLDDQDRIQLQLLYKI